MQTTGSTQHHHIGIAVRQQTAEGVEAGHPGVLPRGVQGRAIGIAYGDQLQPLGVCGDRFQVLVRNASATDERYTDLAANDRFVGLAHSCVEPPAWPRAEVSRRSSSISPRSISYSRIFMRRNRTLSAVFASIPRAVSKYR